jgi:hypothetical protein
MAKVASRSAVTADARFHKEAVHMRFVVETGL